MIAWYAVYTHPHDEEKVGARLREQDYGVYLPRFRRWVRHARRQTIVRRPLFPRYLFVGMSREHGRWRPVRSMPGVVSLVCAGDRPLPLEPALIETLRRQEQDGVFDRLGPELRPGGPVRIIEGSLKDLVGRIAQAGEDERVCILLELFGREVRAEVSARMVEAA